MNGLADGRVGGFIKDVRGYFIYLTPRNFAAASAALKSPSPELSVESGSPGLAPGSLRLLCTSAGLLLQGFFFSSFFVSFFFFFYRAARVPIIHARNPSCPTEPLRATQITSARPTNCEPKRCFYWTRDALL